MKNYYSSKTLVGNWQEEQILEKDIKSSKEAVKNVLRDYDSSLTRRVQKGVEVLPRIRRKSNMTKNRLISNENVMFFEDSINPIGKSTPWFKRTTLKNQNNVVTVQSLMETSYQKSYHRPELSLNSENHSSMAHLARSAGKSTMSKNELMEELYYLKLNQNEDIDIRSVFRMRNSLVNSLKQGEDKDFTLKNSGSGASESTINRFTQMGDIEKQTNALMST